ncbi:MAG TPA: RNA pseudouridine synthase [Bacteroidia bacterium]
MNKEKLKSVSEQKLPIGDLILYEDNHLLIINKPSGAVVQNDDLGTEPLADMVKDFLKERDAKPGNVFCGVIHRIDRPVSGIVVLAKSSKALSRMSELFRTSKIQKTYRALVNGVPEEMEKELVNFLRKNSKLHKAEVFNKKVDNSKECRLKYKVLEVRNHQALLEVYPETGRFHQIRAQLSHLGHPIVGDMKYNAPQALKDRSICLHAYSISFVHPVKNELLEVTSSTKF